MSKKTPEQRQTPRQVINKIQNNFLPDIDSASDMLKEGVLSLQTQLNNALKLLSEDLYSKKSHFVLELIQNADDNHYALGIAPSLTLQVTPSRLVVVNNEVGFTEDNVSAICSVGASSKSKQNAGYIGEKGIGFKSVFTVSDAPEIHSNGFHFKFDRTVEGNLLGYVVPHWCEPPADALPDCTTIVLPAAKNYEFDADTLVDLDARLLLFLNKLCQLTLVLNGQRVTYSREDKDQLSTLSAIRDSEGNEPLSEKMHYVRAATTFIGMDQFADDKRPGTEQSTVVLAFPVDAEGAAKPEPNSHVFAFLPVRQMGFKFSIQADFILSSSREEILTDRPWNQALRNGVAEVFLRAVETFKKFDSLALSYLRYIPAEGEVADPFFRSLRKSIMDKLASAKCLLSESGEWRQPSELRVADRSLKMLLPSKLVQELFGFDYVDSRMQGGDELLRNLGARDVVLQELIKSVFVNHSAWLKNQPLEWRARFFAYVASNQQQLLKAGLLKWPCLPISDGSCVVPEKANVFYSLGKGKKYGFEHELVFVDGELYEEAQKYSGRVVELFIAMKVRSDEPYDLVNAHILPKHNDESWKHSDFKALVGHLRYVKDKLKEYLESAQAHGKSIAQAYELLREGIWIGTKRLVNGSWRFNKVGELYLSKEYKPQFCMESYLPEALDAEKLVSPDYLAKKPKDPDIEAESWRKFFIDIGVRLSPALEADGHDWKCSNEMQLLLDSQSSAVRRATLECMSIHWSHYAPYLIYTHHLGGSKLSTLYTKFALSLRTTQAPTKKRISFPLAEAYYPTTELKMLLGDNLPYVDAVLSETMLNDCGVTHRLDASTLVKRLKQLKAEGGGTPKQVQAIYRALDERLWSSESAYIKQAFSSDCLIQIKRAHTGWFKPSELVWRSNGAFLDSLYPPIHSLYRDFSRFFLDKLGIQHLPTAKRVEALTRLGEIANHDERKAEALAIYQNANHDLGPKFGQAVQAPAWLKTFQTEAVYINQRGELVHNDEYLFVNDVPALGVLFEDDEDLSLLAVPSSELPRLSRLLDATEVPRLSDSITHEVSNADSGVIDEDLTVRVRRSVHFFARVLYAKRPEAFQRALDEGRLASLWELEVANVPQVNLLVSLGDYSRETMVEIALSEGHVLYQTGAKLVEDMLAEELSKFLGASADLADTFARILMANEVDYIEYFLGIKNIGVLPSDLLEALDRSMGQTADEAEVASADSVPAEPFDRVDEAVPEEEPATAEGETDPNEAGAKLSNGGLAASPAPTPTSSGGSGKRGMERGRQGAPRPSTGIDPTHTSSTESLAPTTAPKHAPPTTSQRVPAPQANGAISAPSGVLPSPARSLPLEPQGYLGTGGNSAATRNGGGSASHESSGRPPAGQVDSVRNGQTANGLSNGESRRGQPQPHRTKAGRLLSYAAAPSATDQSNPENDPAMAAAREATARAAVEYFLTTHVGRWKSLIEMPHTNPGFDVLAIAHDGEEEFIEVKGQSGAWTEEGVALTPKELMTAQQKGERYWLCVVEYAQDDKRRQLHLLRNPFGLTQQFRFDVGWKSVAESVATAPLTPEKDMYIDMQGVGVGRILSVRGKGRFFNLHVILDDGRQVNKPFNPSKMTLSKEPAWQG
ncbi:DUF3883 domain-containing protein [Pseudomonas laurylsulfatiphila]|uniref:DUF3883 domain-containing protein n=1 Tax=Pseudomonas laurylsulfatiphila TaxID=2011015 RepID=UPI0021608BAE|nr:DUF3883 domain-containing protein [Pseudomonas laurylsulfatiphila]UVM07111.1 DUF3883 domain-containing protein [Pseudomonas laurylsulfatiphila]